PGAAALVGPPGVGEAAAGLDRGARPVREVVRALVVLVVAEAVRMDADRPPRAVQEVDEDGVPDLRADERPEDAEPRRLRRRGGEGAVGVLDVARLLPLGPIGLRDGPPVHEILARRGKVPDDLLGCDEVLARRAAGRGGEG